MVKIINLINIIFLSLSVVLPHLVEIVTVELPEGEGEELGVAPLGGGGMGPSHRPGEALKNRQLAQGRSHQTANRNCLR